MGWPCLHDSQSQGIMVDICISTLVE